MNARFADPQENLLQMGIEEGMKIGDFGAGTGHYAVAAAGVVGPSGKVYAIDVQEDVAAHLRGYANRYPQIEAIWGDIERTGGTGLRDRALDAAILSNVLFQVAHTGPLLAEVRRVLRREGKLLVIDWAGSGAGPAAHLIFPEQKAETLFIGGGFRKVKNINAGPYHYGILFAAPL